MSVCVLKNMWGDLRKLCNTAPAISRKIGNDMHILFVRAVDDGEQSQVFIYRKSQLETEEDLLPVTEDVCSKEPIFRHESIEDIPKVNLNYLHIAVSEFVASR